jgi:hypothetical protein
MERNTMRCEKNPNARKAITGKVSKKALDGARRSSRPVFGDGARRK